jgi:hypothetical protein
MPLYHCADIFGYWPFGDVLARLWSTYDNNINVNNFKLLIKDLKIYNYEI